MAEKIRVRLLVDVAGEYHSEEATAEWVRADVEQDLEYSMYEVYDVRVVEDLTEGLSEVSLKASLKKTKEEFIEYLEGADPLTGQPEYIQGWKSAMLVAIEALTKLGV